LIGTAIIEADGFLPLVRMFDLVRSNSGMRQPQLYFTLVFAALPIAANASLGFFAEHALSTEIVCVSLAGLALGMFDLATRDRRKPKRSRAEYWDESTPQTNTTLRLDVAEYYSSPSLSMRAFARPRGFLRSATDALWRYIGSMIDRLLA
jgi:hypothetical protein